MSSKSNDQGRAFEYVFINTLYKKLSDETNASLLKDEAYEASENAYKNTESIVDGYLANSALSATDMLFQLEPKLFEESEEDVTLQIQTDRKGEEGDVRDIVIRRDNIRWEIGLSLKHNHFAVKHSRLSKTIDFGEKWYGLKCSSRYWEQVNPIFEELTALRNKLAWNELEGKEDKVYIPLLNAFVEEVKRAVDIDANMPKNMVEYLLGKFDFYKIVSVDKQQMAQINPYNLRGSLNQRSKKKKPDILIPVVDLPTRLIYVQVQPNSKTTVEMGFDKGWSFTFRIHNASTMVEPSLKFDIQFEGLPASIISINCNWYQE